MRGFEPPISCVTGRRFNPLSYTVKVGGAGFEPAKAEPSDLQSDSFNHSEILPYGFGGTRTHDTLVKSQMHLPLCYKPNNVVIIQLSRCWWSLNHPLRIPRNPLRGKWFVPVPKVVLAVWGLVPPPTHVIYHHFVLCGEIGGRLGKCHKQ